MKPEDVMVRGDDEGGWFLHHPDHGQTGPLPTLQTALRKAVELGQRERLDPHIRTTSPLTIPVAKPKATWVEPVVEAEVDFTTGDGRCAKPCSRACVNTASSLDGSAVTGTRAAPPSLLT